MDPHVLVEVEKQCKMAFQKNEDSAFLVFDIDHVIEKVTLWREHMPRFYPYYAVKCNNHPILLETLAYLDVGFDCASKGEIETIVNLGVAIDRIVYSNNFKTLSHLRYAADLKLELMSFDSEEELLKIKRICPSAKLLLRLQVKASHAFVPMSDKFGCDENEVPKILEAALQHDISIVGVSFHVGSHNHDTNDYVLAIKMSKRVFDVAKKKGIAMRMLDIGGGFPGFKSNGDLGKAEFVERARILNKTIEENFPSAGSFEIIAEPGRYFSTAAFTLCANIIGKKKQFVDNEEDTMYVINEGIYGLFVHTVFHKAVPVLREMSTVPELKRSSIWGQTCDPTDLIMKRCSIPDLKVGDWIFFEDMGAYTISCASTFNGFEKTGVKFVIFEKKLYEIGKIARSKVKRFIKAKVNTKGFQNEIKE